MMVSVFVVFVYDMILSYKTLVFRHCETRSNPGLNTGLPRMSTFSQ